MISWETKSGYKITRLLHKRCNVFLLSGKTQHILIDTNRKRFRKPLIHSLEKSGIEKLNALILTHTHFDHAENANFIKKKYNPKVIVHQSESNYLHTGESPLPDGSFFFTGIITRLLAKRVQSWFSYESCLADTEVTDNFSLSDLGFNAYLIHTPGHSQGSMSIIIDDEIALVGDTMESILPYTIFPAFAEEPNQVIISWGRLLESNCRLFLPAHGNVITRERLESAYKKKLQLT